MTKRPKALVESVLSICLHMCLFLFSLSLRTANAFVSVSISPHSSVNVLGFCYAYQSLNNRSFYMVPFFFQMKIRSFSNPPFMNEWIFVLEFLLIIYFFFLNSSFFLPNLKILYCIVFISQRSITNINFNNCLYFITNYNFYAVII